jgi:glycosyltransferase involved in cell wall biosynthesis
MKSKSSPLVSILIPVHNGAEYLAESIESVLAQTYSNWDCTIVDNCSSDESLAIARKYADRDSRIRVVGNDRFLRIIENHNHTIRQISPESKYCKFDFADDWLYPPCVEEMVRLAEEHPTVGLVGAYTMDGAAVLWHGPSYPAHWVSGRDVCRNKLLGGPYVFGTMASLLIRSDLIRKRKTFFNEQNLHSDQEACFDVLQESDFAFVHQVLSFSRRRENSTGSFAANFNSIELGEFVIFLKYGPALLEGSEYWQRLKQIRQQYYRVLGHNVLRIRPGEFWNYHEDTLKAFGVRFDRWLLVTSVIAELASHLRHPIHAFKRGWTWWSRVLGMLFENGLMQPKHAMKALTAPRGHPPNSPRAIGGRTR